MTFKLNGCNDYFNEYYEFNPVFDYEKMAIINSQNREVLLTSIFPFVSTLYLSFNFNYEKLKKNGEKKLKK